MNHDLRYDRQHIVNTYDLLAWVEKDLGMPAQGRHSNTPKWHCPFHSEKTPSFALDVRKGRWTCYGACNCSGNIIDYVQMRSYGRVSNDSDEFKKACDSITGESSPIVRRATPLAPVVAPEKIVDFDELMTYAEAKEQTIPYFAERGVSDKTVCNRFLGAKREHFAKPYELDGEKVWFPSRRYTIPYFSGDVAKDFTMRRDDAKAREDLQAADPELLYEIRCDYARNYPQKFEDASAVSDEVLLDILFGEKYLKAPGKAFPIFNINRLFRLDDAGKLVMHNEKPVLAPLPYAILTEGGEIDVMSAEDSGYFAIGSAFKYGVDYRTLFSKVSFIYLFEEPDAHGREWAQNMSFALSGMRVRVVRPLDGHHDINDMVKSNQIHQWAQYWGISTALPILNGVVA